MAVVVSNQEAFKYWHGSQNQIFATISILIYGLLCRFCFSQMNQHVQKCNKDELNNLVFKG